MACDVGIWRQLSLEGWLWQDRWHLLFTNTTLKGTSMPWTNSKIRESKNPSVLSAHWWWPQVTSTKPLRYPGKGIPWWSSGWHSALSLLWAGGLSPGQGTKIPDVPGHGKKQQQQQKKTEKVLKDIQVGTFLAVQWLRLHFINAGNTVSIPGQRTKISHAMLHSQKTFF